MEFKKYTKVIKVNGHAVKAEVTIQIEEDDPEFLMDRNFENEAQKQAYQAKLENEEIFAGCILVSAKAEGLEGFDSLGACELRPNNMFNSGPFEKSVKSYLKDHELEKIALEHLKDLLKAEYKRLTLKSKQYLKFSSKKGSK